MNKEKQIEEMAWELCDIPKHPNIKSCEQCGNKHCQAMYYAKRAYNAGYRKQSENVIELPCKVGDRMYVKYKGIVYPVRVDAIRIDTKKNNHRICVRGTFHLYNNYSHEYKATFPFESIGKSLFYTDSEAKGGLYGQISI